MRFAVHRTSLCSLYSLQISQSESIGEYSRRNIRWFAQFGIHVSVPLHTQPDLPPLPLQTPSSESIEESAGDTASRTHSVEDNVSFAVHCTSLTVTHVDTSVTMRWRVYRNHCSLDFITCRRCESCNPHTTPINSLCVF